MFSPSKVLASIVATAAIASGGIANAAVVTFNNITASWININPLDIVATGNGTASTSMRWGTPISIGAPLSGYDFVAAATPFNIILPPSPSVNFNIGTWTHLNNPIFAPSLITATLQIDAVISVDGTSVGTRSFLFDYAHNETPNGDAVCQEGGLNGQGANINGCADIVDITFNSMSSNFLVDGNFYTLNLVGGSTHFLTIEAATNAFTLVANLTLDPRVNVPTGGTPALLGLGLLALGWLGRRTQPST